MYLGQISQPISLKSSPPNQTFFGTKSTMTNRKAGKYLTGGFPRQISFLQKLVRKPFCHIFSSKFNPLHPQQTNCLPPSLSLSLFVALSSLSIFLDFAHTLSLSSLNITHAHSLSISPHTHNLPLSLHTNSLSISPHKLSLYLFTHTPSLYLSTHTHYLSQPSPLHRLYSNQ